MDYLKRQGAAPMIERTSLCLPSAEPGLAAHCGEDGFQQNLLRIFPSSENNAAEKLVNLKRELRSADTETFWKRLMEGLTEVCNAQYGFVAKRILVDDHDSAVEMPPIGENGSCLLGVAFYYNDGDTTTAMHRDYKYLAWGAPCSYMKHDKVFLIPEQMSSFITNNPNALPFVAEGYIGIPLFVEGKCFAHFGLMWTQEGLDKRDFSWGYTEMLMHSLEDMIADRLTSGQGFARFPQPATTTEPTAEAMKVIPREAITASQSLKPYAKSLSHELRTPMHGVVGMLDVMYATVQEQIEGITNTNIRQVFQQLKDNIEMVQDSSKRAVEAADNVVHAYDMNMQVPDTPGQGAEPLNSGPMGQRGYFDFKSTKMVEGSNIAVSPSKRRRSSSTTAWTFSSTNQTRHVDGSSVTSAGTEPSPRTRQSVFQEMEVLPSTELPPAKRQRRTPDELRTPAPAFARGSIDSDTFPTPGLRNSNMRELIPTVIQDALCTGGRPESALTVTTDFGERIEVRAQAPSGKIRVQQIEWSVDPDVPETLLVDERDVAKLLSAVILNAIKFTEEGNISLTVRNSPTLRFIVITVVDSGCGIPVDFQPELFKPFSREDDSLTRTKEGLGLGLLVAKGLSRRIGGDLNLVRSDTTGLNKGCEFEIRIPFDSSHSSRPGTPYARTPEPANLPVSTPPNPPARSVGLGTNGGMKRSGDSTPTEPRSPLLEDRDNTASRSVPSALASSVPRRPSLAFGKSTNTKDIYDRDLAKKHPLTFLVAEDNKINRKLLVNMLAKFGYKDVYEAYDGKEAVRIVTDLYRPCRTHGTHKTERRVPGKGIDVILMDLWMPSMDGYEATEHILRLFENGVAPPTILAVSADATQDAIDRASKIGMEGYMTKPYKLLDLQRLIMEFCDAHHR